MTTLNISPAYFVRQIPSFGKIINESVTPWASVILTGCTVAAAGLGIYSWNKSRNVSSADDLEEFQDIKGKVSQAYGYVFGGFALTALSATIAHLSGISFKLLQNSYLGIPLLIGSCVSYVASLAINKKQSNAKHIAWTLFNVTMGVTLSPLGFLNQTIVAQAAAISLGLGGLLTLGAYYAPDKSFLTWEGPLLAALTSISIASCVAFFFPGSAFAYAADRASLYGGLVIFTGLFMASTQRLYETAKKEDDETFDPIRAGMNIYLDGLNIFLRILRIMLENKVKEKN